MIGLESEHSSPGSSHVCMTLVRTSFTENHYESLDKDGYSNMVRCHVRELHPPISLWNLFANRSCAT